MTFFCRFIVAAILSLNTALGLMLLVFGGGDHEGGVVALGAVMIATVVFTAVIALFP
jgi:hypothetical protein